MKKYFTTERYKKFNKRHAKRNLKRKLLRKNKHYHPELQQLGRYDMTLDKNIKYKTIDAPVNFSIVNNSKEVLAFIDIINMYIKQKKAVFIEMEHVTSVTLDAILYTISYFERLRNQHIYYRVNGSFPKDLSAKKLIIGSGFIKHIYPSANITNIQTDILSIRDGYKVNVKAAKDVVNYVRKWLDEDRNNTKSIYNILIECMANTFNHAFIDSGNKHLPNGNNHKWYLMAQHFNNEVIFVFLDNGMGIAQTIQKKFTDIVKNEANLILSALQGNEFRTQTGERKRGKGLPNIHKRSKDENIKELIIIANKGLVNVKNDIPTTINKNFKGTLLSWKIKKCQEDK